MAGQPTLSLSQNMSWVRDVINNNEAGHIKCKGLGPLVVTEKKA